MFIMNPGWQAGSSHKNMLNSKGLHMSSNNTKIGCGIETIANLY